MEREASYQSADADDGWGEDDPSYDQPPMEKQPSLSSSAGGAAERDEVDKVFS